MEVTYVNPVGVIVLCAIISVSLVLFVLFKFVIKFRSDLFNAFYWTEVTLGQSPECSIRLLDDRLRVEMGSLFEKGSFEILYQRIDAFGRESTDLFRSTVFVATGEKIHFFGPNRPQQLVLELTKRIEADRRSRGHNSGSMAQVKTNS